MQKMGVESGSHQGVVCLNYRHMEKIIQLSEREYEKLFDLAKLNKEQIEERALKMYEEKGVAELDISIRMSGGEYERDYNFACSTHLWYKDEKFFISEKLRKRLAENVNEWVIDAVEDKYGNAVKWLNRFRKEAKMLRITRYTAWAVAASGWAAFAGCLYDILTR